MPVREIVLSYAGGVFEKGEVVPPNIRTAAAAAAVMAPLLEKEVCEVGCVMCLTARLDLIGYHEVSRGTVNTTPMCPREVFRVAMLANAVAIIVLHNHPSGDPTPSPDDMAVAKRIKDAGEMIGIEMLDFMVIGHEGRYASLREIGWL